MNIDAAELPPFAHELADVIGLDATLALIEARGGVRLFVPATIPNDHWLIGTIGRTAADELARIFAGEINIPKGSAAIRGVLYRRIVADYAEGVSAAHLAREHGLTERRIYQIVASRRAELASLQADLF